MYCSPPMLVSRSLCLPLMTPMLMYVENSDFSPWKGERIVEDYYLPRMIQKLTGGQRKCRIGDALISTFDSCMGTETCEELFTPRSPGISAGLDGCEIISKFIFNCSVYKVATNWNSLGANISGRQQ